LVKVSSGVVNINYSALTTLWPCDNINGLFHFVVFNYLRVFAKQVKDFFSKIFSTHLLRKFVSESIDEGSTLIFTSSLCSLVDESTLSSQITDILTFQQFQYFPYFFPSLCKTCFLHHLQNFFSPNFSSTPFDLLTL